MIELKPCRVFPFVLLTLLPPVVSLSGCERSSNEAPAPASSTTITSAPVEIAHPNETPDTVPAGTPQAGTLSDPEIIAAVYAASDAALEQAEQTLRSGTNLQAKQFAQRVVNDLHASAAKLSFVESRAAVPSAPSSLSEQLRSDGARFLASMRASTEVGVTFVDARVSEGSRLLDLLDGQLIPEARDPQLRAFLRDFRTTIANEVTTAQGLHQALSQ